MRSSFDLVEFLGMRVTFIRESAPTFVGGLHERRWRNSPWPWPTACYLHTMTVMWYVDMY